MILTKQEKILIAINTIDTGGYENTTIDAVSNFLDAYGI